MRRGLARGSSKPVGIAYRLASEKRSLGRRLECPERALGIEAAVWVALLIPSSLPTRIWGWFACSDDRDGHTTPIRTIRFPNAFFRNSCIGIGQPWTAARGRQTTGKSQPPGTHYRPTTETSFSHQVEKFFIFWCQIPRVRCGYLLECALWPVWRRHPSSVHTVETAMLHRTMWKALKSEETSRHDRGVELKTYEGGATR